MQRYFLFFTTLIDCEDCAEFVILGLELRWQWLRLHQLQTLPALAQTLNLGKINWAIIYLQIMCKYSIDFIVLRGSIWFFLSRFYIVNGNYSDWGPYGECSKTCGGGVKTRKRTCTNPPPASGGADCSALGPDTSTMECNIQGCPGIMKKKIWDCF